MINTVGDPSGWVPLIILAEASAMVPGGCGARGFHCDARFARFAPSKVSERLHALFVGTDLPMAMAVYSCIQVRTSLVC